ncbi:MAG: DUF664 domain-containing protein [Azospirillum sp.]|nr:DUF664 domain-containing protein [Azospirillum sp.]
MIRHFETFAAYNRWANRRVFRAVAELPDAQARRDQGAFFGSLIGTLNHILVADRLWLARFTGAPAPGYALDTILHPDLVELTAARDDEDARIIAFVATQDDQTLARPFSYRTTKGDVFTQELAPVLAHFFNHQTHHRGQAHTLLSQSGREPPELDLVYFQREQAR